MTDQIIGSYKNGNYKTIIFSDGSKLRYNKESTLVPERPESMDIKITDMCDMECPYCHENSKINGKHGDIMNAAFIRKLKPFTELAIGGGNPLSHPQLIRFLRLCREKKLIASITVNQHHFMENYKMIKMLSDQKLIYGIGISVTNVTEELIAKTKTLNNAVLHVIAGIITQKQLSELYDNNLKMLILGYKTFRRGEDFYSDAVSLKIETMKKELPEIIKHFNTISFDNLAIQQLDVKSIVPNWRQFYMGHDGEFTMYVDMVKHEFATGSTSTKRYPYTTESIEEMFTQLRKETLCPAHTL